MSVKVGKRMYSALIIDDERPARQVIIALGKWEKYGIMPPLEASNCIDALAVMEKKQPDIVFLDMYLPVMNGIEFLKAAAPSYKKTKFIVVSGFDEFEYARQSLRYGVVEYLLKPVLEDELERALARAVYMLDADIEQLGDDDYGERFKHEAAEGGDPYRSFGMHSSMEDISEEIRDYIETNYASEINLDMFSQQYYLTKEYLSRCFKEIVGFGIYEYVTRTRMSKVKVLLRDTDAMIRDVAAAVGYNDQNHFSKAFKKYFGMYPSQYRAQSSAILQGAAREEEEKNNEIH